MMFKVLLLAFFCVVAVNAFGGKAKQPSSVIKSNEAIAVYRKLRDPAKIKKGGMFDRTDAALSSTYTSLVKALKTEEDAMKAVKAYPDVLLTDDKRVLTNFNIYSEKWGFDKAKTVVQNNPSLLQVQSTGYGSAEAAADETVYVSYIVAATRPTGPILLSLLFLALGKAIVFGI